MTLRDLTVIEDSALSVKDGQVNFSKCKLTYNILSHVSECQQSSYPFQSRPEVLGLLTSWFVPVDEADLWRLSEELEAPGSRSPRSSPFRAVSPRKIHK